MKRAQKTQDLMVKKEKFQRQQFPSLVPKTENQARFIDSLKYDTISVADGVSGSGKTYIACWHAARKLYYGDIKKIVLIRAYQPLAGRSIGLLPGTLQEKLQPYYQQMIDYFEDFLGKASTDIHLKQGTIEICSLETIRGRSWSDAIVAIEESQNLFVPEVQALVTRIGQSCQMIFAGDDSGCQTDVKNSMNGLTYLKSLTDRYNIEEIGFTKFGTEDIVRSGIVKSFVLAFEQEAELDKTGKAIISQVDQDKQFKKGR
jgi:phosphate starvation-inducible protein PhoH and related proteins